jgi:hypothetical protein
MGPTLALHEVKNLLSRFLSNPDYVVVRQVAWSLHLLQYAGSWFITQTYKTVPLNLARGEGNFGEEICALLGYYTTSNGNPLPTFRNVSVPSSRVKNLETSAKDYH